MAEGVNTKEPPDISNRSSGNVSRRHCHSYTALSGVSSLTLSQENARQARPSSWELTDCGHLIGSLILHSLVDAKPRTAPLVDHLASCD